MLESFTVQPDTRDEIVTRLPALVDENPEQAVGELESLREVVLVLDFVEILGFALKKWEPTGTSWKLGNREQFLEMFPNRALRLGSLPFSKVGDAGSQARYSS
jgi:hypothetical protein